MPSKSVVVKALDVLLHNDVFHLEQISYDKQGFGNICVTLNSKELINIRFIKDRGQFYCEIGYEGEWYLLEDVFAIIGETFEVNKDEFYDFVANVSFLIESNLSHILKIFSPLNVEKTQLKLKEIEITRTRRLYDVKRN